MCSDATAGFEVQTEVLDSGRRLDSLAHKQNAGGTGTNRDKGDYKGFGDIDDKAPFNAKRKQRCK